MRNMLGRIVVSSSIVAVVLLVVLLQTTTPATIGPLGILVAFILMYLSVLGALTFLLFGISKLIHRLSVSFTVKKPLQGLTFNKAYYFSSVIALAPIMFIGMQSVSEVSFYDIILVVTFAAIACVYIAKRTS